jgi:hypothetical protein
MYLQFLGPAARYALRFFEKVFPSNPRPRPSAQDGIGQPTEHYSHQSSSKR